MDAAAETYLAYVALGANLGPRAETIAGALCELAALPGIAVLRCSALVRTRPLGPPQPEFLNAVAEVRTTLEPSALLGALLSIERGFGRTRDVRWGPRLIDLDLIAMLRRDGAPVVIETPSLMLPHPGVSARDFVLAPLCELAPLLPLGETTAAALLEALDEDARTVLGPAALAPS